jgi:hypothetical protein
MSFHSLGPEMEWREAEDIVLWNNLRKAQSAAMDCSLVLFLAYIYVS